MALLVRPLSRSRAGTALRRVACLLLALCLAPAAARALAPEEHPELNDFIARMTATHDFKRADLERWFARAAIKPEILAAMDRPAEALPWHEYRKRFVTDEHLRLGVRFFRDHRAALARAERDYGVPAELVVAIIGIETQYGRNGGDFYGLDALSTLAFRYPRRAAFFQQELEQFLLLAREQKLDPAAIKSSYAGALGIPQFIPSSYRRYAIDFDGDRRVDLLKNRVDAIGSVAHFLARHGWRRGEPIVQPAELRGPLNGWLEELGPKPLFSVGQLVAYGVHPRAQNGDPAQHERPAALLTFQGEDGPFYRLGFENFYVITRYNRSTRYAFAVHELGRLIREQHERGE